MTSKMMKRWTIPRDYMGEKWSDYYVAIGRHRDSDLLTESNFSVFAEAMKTVDTRDNWPPETHWRIVREGHWAVGWVEWIAIHKNAQVHIERADELLERLADYPVLDEEDYSNRQYDAALRGVTDAVSMYARRNSNITKAQVQAAIDTLMNECEDFGGNDGEGYYPPDEVVAEVFTRQGMVA